VSDRFLLDRDVLQAMEHPRGNANVRAWATTVSDDSLYVSAITVMEARKGLVRLRLRATTNAQFAVVQRLERLFDVQIAALFDRLLPVDRAVADAWGDMLAQRDANTMDTALAATALVHGLVVATRNLRHFRGRGVALIDPFRANPQIER
jgi:toxin FitB